MLAMLETRAGLAAGSSAPGADKGAEPHGSGPGSFFTTDTFPMVTPHPPPALHGTQRSRTVQPVEQLGHCAVHRLLCRRTWVTVLPQDIGDSSGGGGGDTCP